MGSQATRPWLVWTVMVLAALSLILVIINAVLAFSNSSAQEIAQHRQQEINQTAFLTRFERSLTQALATGAVSHRDEDVKNLLQKHGITISNWPAANGTASAPVKPAAGGAK